MFAGIASLHNSFFTMLSRATDGWLLGSLARFVFAAVLFMYFFNSALTKFEGGPFSVSDGAYIQILPTVMEAYGYDASQIPFNPYGIIVLAGSYGEIILPILIVLGLFTRIAAIGMIVFVAVQSYVDIALHHADAATVGTWFDNLSNAVIMDQRALWIFLLLYLVLRGPGAISIDHWLSRRADDY